MMKSSGEIVNNIVGQKAARTAMAAKTAQDEKTAMAAKTAKTAQDEKTAKTAKAENTVKTAKAAKTAQDEKTAKTAKAGNTAKTAKAGNTAKTVQAAKAAGGPKQGNRFKILTVLKILLEETEGLDASGTRNITALSTDEILKRYMERTGKKLSKETLKTYLKVFVSSFHMMPGSGAGCPLRTSSDGITDADTELMYDWMHEDEEDEDEDGNPGEVPKSGQLNYFYMETPYGLSVPEIRLLIDIIQSARSLPKEETEKIIGKLKALTPRMYWDDIEGQMYGTSSGDIYREKTRHSPDAIAVGSRISEAIRNRCLLAFRYRKWQWDEQAGRYVLVPRKAEDYIAAPWAAMWNEEDSYMVAAMLTEEPDVRHFRADKMQDVRIIRPGSREWNELSEESRQLAEKYLKQGKEFSVNDYRREHFGMFGGRKEEVRLRIRSGTAEASGELIGEVHEGVVLNYFGKENVRFSTKREDGWATVRLIAAVSPQFYRWVAGLGTDAEITGPQWVRDGYITFLKNSLKAYGDRK